MVPQTYHQQQQHHTTTTNAPPPPPTCNNNTTTTTTNNNNTTTTTTNNNNKSSSSSNNNNKQVQFMQSVTGCERNPKNDGVCNYMSNIFDPRFAALCSSALKVANCRRCSSCCFDNMKLGADSCVKKFPSHIGKQK